MPRLVSVNIEGPRHVAERVVPFLARVKPDILCVQELLARDFPTMVEHGGPYSDFAPMAQYPKYTTATDPDPLMGIGIFSRYPMRSERRYYRSSASGRTPTRVAGDLSTLDHALLVAELEVDGICYPPIATTHFAWSERGEPNDYQRRDLSRMLAILGEYEGIAFCGDFNLPRGGELFSRIAAEYTDHIPPHYKTSVDIALHRHGKAHRDELSTKMVDGFFSTSHFRVENVRLESGVSDHMAIVLDVFYDHS